MPQSKGVHLVLTTALISGFAVFFNKFALQAIGKNPYQFTTLKNLLVAIILILLVFSPSLFRELKKLRKKDWLNLILIGLIGGSLPFLLFFKGLALTTSTSAAFIHKTLFIWVSFLALFFLKEKITKLQFLALLSLLFGTWLLEGFNSFNLGQAELLIFLATIFWSFEYLLVKRLLKNIAPLIVAWARMFFGVIIMLGFLMLTSNTQGLFNLTPSQTLWLIFSGLLLFGYVTTWYFALKYEKASIVACLLVPGSLLTTLLNSAFVTRSLSSEKIISMLIILLGLILFYRPGSKLTKVRQIQAART